VKDPIYNTPHPEQGAITLVTDWSGIGEGLTAPASYTVEAGDYSATLTGTTNLLEPLFEPGSYCLHIYNTPQHITVSGITATVAGGLRAMWTVRAPSCRRCPAGCLRMRWMP